MPNPEEVGGENSGSASTPRAAAGAPRDDAARSSRGSWFRSALLLVAILLTLGVGTVREADAGKYETNKWDRREEIAEGGWFVAYGAELTETDLIDGIVAAGVSIAMANPGPFIAWCESLVDRSIAKLEEAVSNVARYLGREALARLQSWAVDRLRTLIGARQDASHGRRFAGLDCKVGLARYSGANREWFSNFSREGGYWHTISRTFSAQPYIAVRIHDELERTGAEGLPEFSAAVWAGGDDDRAYFFAGDKYYRFDLGDGRFDKVGTIGKDGWEGLWTEGIDAAVRGGDGNLYFFKGSQYKRWVQDEGGRGRVDKTGTVGADGWRGLWTGGIDAAVNHPNGNIYFFKGDRCLRWVPGQGPDGGGTVGKDGWRGLWTDGIGAALDHPNGRIYFFRGDRFLRWEPGEGVTKRGRVGRTGWRVTSD